MTSARFVAQISFLVVLPMSLAGDLAAGQSTTRVSVDPSGGQADGDSSFPSITADGGLIAFTSQATNLVPGDTNSVLDVFVRDLKTGATLRASVDFAGAQGNASSYNPVLSADGRFVAFWSLASNLVPGDANTSYDVFLHDLRTDRTSRMSIDTLDAEGNGDSVSPSISADGHFVAFFSLATNLVASDTNGLQDVFVHDRLTGATTRVSVDSSGAQANDASYDPSISADGRLVAFWSYASNLVAGDTNGKADVFVHDRLTGATTRVSVDSSGMQASSDSTVPHISADGRHVVFVSQADDLVPGDTNASPDIFVHDRLTGATSRVSVDSEGNQANAGSAGGSVSADGRYVAFHSQANNLVAGDTNGVLDAFVHDRLSGATTRLSVDSAGAEGDAASFAGPMSADGRYVAFESNSTNLIPGDTNGARDIFLRDRGEPLIVASCFGDGTGALCPCGNRGHLRRGCENSSGTGGARLDHSGTPRLSADSLVLTSSGERAAALSLFLQGSALEDPVNFGDGLRCTGGAVSILYVKRARNGIVAAPEGGELSISERSAALGDAIPTGATRHYQTYYRERDVSFCPNPPGDAWNIGNALSAVWSP